MRSLKIFDIATINDYKIDFLFVADRTAGINLLEAAYKLAPLNTAHYKSMQKATKKQDFP